MIATYEAEVAAGLEAIAAEEIQASLGSHAAIIATAPGLVQFTCKGGASAALRLKTVIAVYALHTFAVPRPKALLGHQHFTAILGMIDAARPNGTYTALSIDAAGSESSVMQRLRAELAAAVGLQASPDKADLHLRLRRTRTPGGEGWDVLVRLTPRPLATRDWRVCNLEGALNASVAHAIMRRLAVAPGADVLNLLCGSGTLLIERGDVQARFTGLDHDPAALLCARRNLAAAGVSAALLRADAGALPFDAASVDALCADLPFGQLMGSHAENTRLYPVVLREAARVAKIGARFAVITHEVRLMDAVLRQQQAWRPVETLRVTLGGLHPRVDVLVRVP